MKTDTEIPKQRCWKCGYEMDQTSDALGDAKPKEGDWSICLGCGTVCIFTKDFMLRKPTPNEQAEIDANPVILKTQIYRADIVGDKLTKRHHYQDGDELCKVCHRAIDDPLHIPRIEP
jgi:hypothetical protein